VRPSRRSPGRAARAAWTGAPGSHAPEREGRQLALAAVFEADFGQRTAEAALARRLSEGDIGARAAAHARAVVQAVAQERHAIDALIERVAPAYPVVQLARIDRALLRCGVGELLHCPATPARVAVSEWVELARTYSGEPARRLVNGALGRLAAEAADATAAGRDQPAPGAGGARETRGHTEGAPE
jgi:transcription antitermination protein NusB